MNTVDPYNSDVCMGPDLNKKNLLCFFFLTHLHDPTVLKNIVNIFLEMFPLLLSSLTSDHFVKLPFVECLLYIIHRDKHLGTGLHLITIP